MVTAYILLTVGLVGTGTILWRRYARMPRHASLGGSNDFALAAETSVMREVAEGFLTSIGGLAGGLLVLEEVHPFGAYVRLRGHDYEEILARNDADRHMGEKFDQARGRWTDAQRAAVGRLEDEWPRLDSLMRRSGLAADATKFADIVLVTKLCRLLADPIEKNHRVIVDGFLSQPADASRDDCELIKDFLRYMDERDLLPNDREIAARLCVLRATTPLRGGGAATVRDLCERWGEEWHERFPRAYIADATPYVYRLYMWILADVFASLGRAVPTMSLDSGVFRGAVDAYSLDRYEDELQAGSASTISDMGRRPQRN